MTAIGENQFDVKLPDGRSLNVYDTDASYLDVAVLPDKAYAVQETG